MSTYTEHALMNCADPQGGQIAVTLDVTDTTFTVTMGEVFHQWIVDNTMSEGGKTIGELSANHLHRRLDEFCGVGRSLVRLSAKELDDVFEGYNHQNYANSSKEELVDFGGYVELAVIKKNGG